MQDSFIIIGSGGHAKSVSNLIPMAMGIGGITPDALKCRLAKMREYIRKGNSFPTLIHPSAVVSATARLEDGVQVMPLASVGAYAQVGLGAIINTGAIVEHGVIIGAGAHIAPGAIVLGDAIVEESTMVGAGAVVVQGTTASGFIKALTVSK